MARSQLKNSTAKKEKPENFFLRTDREGAGSKEKKEEVRTRVRIDREVLPTSNTLGNHSIKRRINNIYLDNLYGLLFY